MKKEKPIFFDSTGAASIVEGTKTQTRIVIKPNCKGANGVGAYTRDGNIYHEMVSTYDKEAMDYPPIPYPYKPGDRLWVKETWQAIKKVSSRGFEDLYDEVEIVDWLTKIPKEFNGWELVYKADPCWESHRDDRGFPWQPSARMPRWAARTVLEVISVHPEKLLDISEDDAIAEGFSTNFEWIVDPIKHFLESWDENHAKINSAKSNPWVWVIKFKVISIY